MLKFTFVWLNDSLSVWKGFDFAEAAVAKCLTRQYGSHHGQFIPADILSGFASIRTQ